MAVTNSVAAPPESTVEPSAAAALLREVTNRMSVVKVPVSASGGKKKYLKKLLELVPIVDTLTAHMQQFLCLIAIAETSRDPLFNPSYLLDESYFYRVFMAFCKHRQDKLPTAIVDDVAGVSDVIEDDADVVED